MTLQSIQYIGQIATEPRLLILRQPPSAQLLHILVLLCKDAAAAVLLVVQPRAPDIASQVSVRRHRSACGAGEVQRPDQVIVSKHKQVQARASRAVVLLELNAHKAVQPPPLPSLVADGEDVSPVFSRRGVPGESFLPSGAGRGRCAAFPRLERLVLAQKLAVRGVLGLAQVLVGHLRLAPHLLVRQLPDRRPDLRLFPAQAQHVCVDAVAGPMLGPLLEADVNLQGGELLRGLL